MVTSNKLSDKKVVKMAEQDHNNIAVVPQRTLLGEVNEHITCPLCRGYYIDATTIVECLHSFCRSCIIKHLQVKSYCPVCEMMINSAKPNIKLDKALQDIVYKLVPGLFQKEMERRQQFYASRPGTAASATPEQRGEDTERIIFSPEDVISFSLEYADSTDADSISSKSSDSNEPQNNPATTRRYLQCPAVVNISHLKKFLSMKFDIDSTQFAIDILYKRVPLSDYYTLMDIAYIFNWKRNEPMRFFYQIIDYVAIRNRLFDINRKGSHFRDRKSSPASTEDTNVSSPAPHLNDQGSEASSGTDSPMPEDSSKHGSDNLSKNDKSGAENKNILEKTSTSNMSPKNTDEDVEKSQFLNSFELTAKSNCVPMKSSPTKNNISEEKPTPSTESTQKIQMNLTEKSPKMEEKPLDSLKRKNQTSPGIPEIKKLKVELEKAKLSNYLNNTSAQQSPSNQSDKSKTDNTICGKQTDGLSKGSQVATLPSNTTSTSATKDIKQQHQVSTVKQVIENPVLKRPVTVSQNTSTPKRKPPNEATISSAPLSSMTPKVVSPLKLHIPKLETQSHNLLTKPVEIQKPPMKKMPDLKPSGPMSQTLQGKSPTVNKVRMDLLANNSDPTIDRSKILSQVKSSLSVQTTSQTSGDPLKSLFDSCKINIPSSLSITLTDQKLDNRPSDVCNVEVKKNIVNKNIAGASNISSHKVPSPPVHNYIEILKLPDTDSKKQMKSDSTSDTKANPQNKQEGTSSQPKPPTKTSESSAKGPIPNLKPIADTKLGKQSGSFSAPITFQQTFEQQLQSMQCDKKGKLPKNKTQVPKLVPATPKSLSAVNKPNHPVNKPVSGNISTTENKTSTALDLSTPHNIQTQLDSQQTYKTLETMQTIANLAKKQNLPSKVLSVSMPHNNVFPSISNRTMTTAGVSPLRVPTTTNINQIKLDKMNALASLTSNNSRQDTQNKTNQMKVSNNASPTMSPLSYPIGSHTSASTAQPSPRSQTRSPSSSPKLVIAEEKQNVNSVTDHTMNQSNQITSTQLTNINMPKSESPKVSPGPSKSGLKPVKPLTSGKVASIWQPLTPTMKTNPTMSSPSDFLSQQLARQMEVNAWIKAHRQYEYIKNMSNIAHQAENDFNNQDKQ